MSVKHATADGSGGPFSGGSGATSGPRGERCIACNGRTPRSTEPWRSTSMTVLSPADLTRALPGVQVVTDDYVLAALAADDAEWAPVGRPLGAVRATSSAEVQQVVAACAELGIPVVTRGAGTGLSGGANAVDGCVVLDLSPMNRILEIDVDNMVAVVEPGVVNDDLKAAVAKHG